jgi:hypothetical protein
MPVHTPDIQSWFSQGNTAVSILLTATTKHYDTAATDGSNVSKHTLEYCAAKSIVLEIPLHTNVTQEENMDRFDATSLYNEW